MTRNIKHTHGRLSVTLAALALGMGGLAATPAAAMPAAARMYKPTSTVLLSIGEGQQINLPTSVTDVWTSNADVADVYVTNARRINLFGKKFGDATIIATAANGAVVYASNVRVSQNITSVDAMLRAAMPDANVHIQNVGQMVVMTGTVASPDDSAQAEQLVAALLNPGVDTSKPGATLAIVPFNRLRVATPLQVNLNVRIAEVNRSLVKSIGLNLLAQNRGTGSSLFAIGHGNPGTLPTATSPGTYNLAATGSTLAVAGKLLGLDLLSTLNLAQNDGLVTTLAEPNLTALSGETASFLAGGEFPIPLSGGNGSVSVEYKPYGVSLAFTPTVLGDGRISMRVRPEVSELSNQGAVKIGGFEVPGITTRRAETTVELGSGQSFMIAGLLRNNNTNSVEKAPFLGDLPILGNLFKSTNFRRDETELVIIITPYLVRPTSGHLSTPADGYRAPSDAEQFLEGQTWSQNSVSGHPATALAPRPALSAPAANAAIAAAPIAAPGFSK